MYLDDLDDLLRGGAAALGAPLRQCQRRYVLGLQRPDGGWAGRAGPSDPYYTDFALRILRLTSFGVRASARAFSSPQDAPETGVNVSSAATQDLVDQECRARAAAFLRSCPDPCTVVECFSTLNISRMLSLPSLPSLPALLSHWLLPAGGFSRPGSPGASAYATFLAALSFEMLNLPFPEPGPAVAAIFSLKRPDGGYADLPAAAAGQTSATAAAIAFLTMRGALTAPDPSAVDFLRAVQSPTGGFLPTGSADLLSAPPSASQPAPSSPENPQSSSPIPHSKHRLKAELPNLIPHSTLAPDLLSTFTALVALFALDGLKRIDLKGVASFVSSLAVETGGFRATAADPAPDLEYTYYGLATLALVRVYIALMKSFA